MIVPPLKTPRIKAFTLLEVIIVIIIIGVLASLALPRFFRLVEYSRSVEAVQSILLIRNSMERCYLMTMDYKKCRMNSPGPNPNNLDIQDPGTAPNTHFSYAVDPPDLPNLFLYQIKATRNTLDSGNAGDFIRYVYLNDGTVTRSGAGAFAGIQ